MLNPPPASPRKRVKSAPSTISSLLDAENELRRQQQAFTADIAGVPDLKDLLQSQRMGQANYGPQSGQQNSDQSVQQSYLEQNITRDPLAKRPAIIPCQGGGPSQETRPGARPFSPNRPSANILGNLHEPFGQEQGSPANSMGQNHGYTSPIASSIHQALLMLQRQKPAVHITTASTVANQIHQLLTSMPKTVTPLSPTSVPTPQNTPVSPIQSKNPTLVNTLSSSVPAVGPSTNNSHRQVGIINIVPDSEKQEEKSDTMQHGEGQGRGDRTEIVQKLQFHDFPLTMSSLSATQSGSKATQSRILSSKSIETETQSKPQSIHITVNKSHTSQMVSPFSNLTQALSSLGTSRPNPNIIITSAGSQSKESSSTQTSLSATSTVTFKPVPERQTASRPERASFPGPATVSSAGLPRQPEKVIEIEESLGKVSSLLESSPITEKTKTTSPEPAHSNISVVHIKPNIISGAPASSSGHHAIKPSTPKPPSATVASYSSTAKPIIATAGSTRTRKIKTPKQYDL